MCVIFVRILSFCIVCGIIENVNAGERSPENGDNMSNNRLVAMENVAITEKGSYTLDGREVVLGTPEELQKVVLCRPEFTRECVDGALAAIKDAPEGMAEVEVNACDTFGALKALSDCKASVLNFANARWPGGGYLHGSFAQEETLCRCSTLFASLTNREADELYLYNRANRTPEGSDYMLVSPNVKVFRDVPELKLRSEPYDASVITYAAPNRESEAKPLDDAAIEKVFMRKIVNVFGVAWHFGYDALVLGAWGCGAFGNDARTVARLYREAIYESGFGKLFKKIVFAIYTPPTVAPGYNYYRFKECFE